MTASEERSCLAAARMAPWCGTGLGRFTGWNKEDYEPAEAALKQVVPGASMVFWQPRDESLPPSGSFEVIHVPFDANACLGSDYSGVIDSSLAAVCTHSENDSPERAMRRCTPPAARRTARKLCAASPPYGIARLCRLKRGDRLWERRSRALTPTVDRGGRPLTLRRFAVPFCDGALRSRRAPQDVRRLPFAGRVSRTVQGGRGGDCGTASDWLDLPSLTRDQRGRSHELQRHYHH